MSMAMLSARLPTNVALPEALYAPQPEQHCLSFHHCRVRLWVLCTIAGPTTQMFEPVTFTPMVLRYVTVVAERSYVVLLVVPLYAATVPAGPATTAWSAGQPLVAAFAATSCETTH